MDLSLFEEKELYIFFQTFITKQSSIAKKQTQELTTNRNPISTIQQMISMEGDKEKEGCSPYWIPRRRRRKLSLQIQG